ncbi:MAG: hypothetical protein C4527_23300 [Candidatus Omnitrophota bacterium]|jgi:type II secretory pathway component PulF|nr:MAG: hypothetical protein C4527_23300 [Candidatus Omnitrophota bacterium]
MVSFARLSLKKRYFFYTQLAQMLDAGITPLRSLKMLSEQRKEGVIAKIAEQMRAHIEAGGTLATAMAMFPNRFPPMETQLIETAETAGIVPTTLNRLAEFNRLIRNYRAEFLNRMLYPFFIVFVVTFFLPVFVSIFIGNVVDALIGCAWNLFYLSLLVFVVRTIWQMLINIPSTRFMIHRILLAIPLFGGYLRKLMLARFAKTLEFLYAAGVPVADSLTLASKSCGNEAMARRLYPTTKMVRDGMTITAALGKTYEFTPLALGIIESGEVSGKLDVSLRKFAEYMELEAWSGIQQLATLLPVLIYFNVVCVIVYMVFQAFQGYLGVVQQTTQ